MLPLRTPPLPDLQIYGPSQVMVGEHFTVSWSNDSGLTSLQSFGWSDPIDCGGPGVPDVPYQCKQQMLGPGGLPACPPESGTCSWGGHNGSYLFFREPGTAMVTVKAVNSAGAKQVTYQVIGIVPSPSPSPPPPPPIPPPPTPSPTPSPTPTPPSPTPSTTPSPSPSPTPIPSPIPSPSPTPTPIPPPYYPPPYYPPPYYPNYPTPFAIIQANGTQGSVSIPLNGSAIISWTSGNAFSCSVSPSGWTGVVGAQSTGVLTGSRTYALNCTGPGGSASDSVTVYIGQSQGFNPSVFTNPASVVGETNATIHGTVNPQGSQSSAWFEYGTTESLGNIVGTQSVGSGLFDIAHSFSLSGLQSNRTYYFRAIAENQYGKTYGGIVSFATAPKQQQSSPLATTHLATAVEARASTLQGSSTGSRQIESGFSNQNFAHRLTDLNPDSIYYYRAVIQNQNGAIAKGATLAFRTAKLAIFSPPVSPLPSGFEDLSLEKEVSGLCQSLSCSVATKETTVLGGNVVEYTIRVTNTGTLPVRDIIIEDELSDSVVFAFASNNGAYDDARKLVTWHIENLARGKTQAVSVVVTAKRLSQDAAITNVAIARTSNFLRESNSVAVAIKATEESNEGVASVLGAFFSNGSLWWLLFLILLIVLLLFAFFLYKKRRKAKKEARATSLADFVFNNK